MPLTLLRLGADAEVKFIPVSSSPPLDTLIGYLRSANDLDGDGYGSWLGENDCAPFDAGRHPMARDLPDDGVDQNCDGRDFSLRDLARPAGGGAPVPPAFRRPWNVLLITIDTVRYDHTSFGGYRDGPRGRDTTPRLAELAARGTSFTFAQAPSAGTMASVPAILTSKFFHSGIPLGPERKGTAPKVLPEATLIGEIAKRKGYRTGAITTHPYFNDWGLDQGIDDYDNSIGRDNDPFRIAAHLVTDRALAWVAKQRETPWLLWTHYIDPHGRYVAHPDGPAWGDREEDLYDGELHYTDRHIGRLLDELSRMPGADRTIVVVTSDHGDGFGEHGFINHGQALYRELLHVPLIVYVPDNLPRVIGGAVSGLDVVPTIAELIGAPVDDLSFEGESLVPQIFYGTEDRDRIVFAETNWPQPLRAAISADHKLVYNLKSNLYELYDLARDPWEKVNLASKDPTTKARYQAALDAWLERVLYTRDAATNQAAAKMAELIVTTRPEPEAATSPAPTLDGGRLAVLGASLAEPGKLVKPGDSIDLYVYFEVTQPVTQGLRLGLEVATVDRAGYQPGAPRHGALARAGARLTLDGLFPTDRWRVGEFVRDRFTVKLPRDATGDALAVTLIVTGERGKEVGAAGPGASAGRIDLGLVTWPRPAPAPAGIPGPGAP
ncbi:MAG: sulfatase [Kofleriaceae bacterium]